MGNITEKAKELAKYEVGWWRAHHHKDFSEVTRNMAMEYTLLFGIPYEVTVEAIKHRVEAAKIHDEAERLEDAGNLECAGNYWRKAEELLQKHFELLLK